MSWSAQPTPSCRVQLAWAAPETLSECNPAAHAAHSRLPGLLVYGSLLFLSSPLGNVPLSLEAFWRRTRRNGNGVCGKALFRCPSIRQALSLGSWLKAIETYLETSAERDFSRRQWGHLQDLSKGWRVWHGIFNCKLGDTCPGFTTTSWLHTMECNNSPEESGVLLRMD